MSNILNFNHLNFPDHAGNLLENQEEVKNSPRSSNYTLSKIATIVRKISLDSVLFKSSSKSHQVKPKAKVSKSLDELMDRKPICGLHRTSSCLVSPITGINGENQQLNFDVDLKNMIKQLNNQIKIIIKNYPQDLELTYLNPLLSRLVEEHMLGISDLTKTSLEELNCFYEQLISCIIEKLEQDSLFLSILKKRLQELRSFLTSQRDQKNKDWMTAFSFYLFDLIMSQVNFRDFFIIILQIKDKKMQKLILKIIGGKQGISFFDKGWKSIVVCQIDDMIQCQLKNQLLKKHYYLTWEAKEECFVDNIRIEEIERSIFQEEDRHNFRSLTIIAMNPYKMDKAIEIPSLYSNKEEFLILFLKTIQECGWEFSPEEGPLEEQALKLLNKQELSVNKLLKAMTNITLQPAIFENIPKHYHQQLYDKEIYWTQMNMAQRNGGTGIGIDCHVRISSPQFFQIIREWTNDIYIYNKKYLSPQEQQLLQEDQEGKGFQIAQVRNHYTCTYRMLATGYSEWTGELKISDLTIFKETPLRFCKDIICIYSEKMSEDYKQDSLYQVLGKKLRKRA